MFLFVSSPVVAAVFRERVRAFFEARKASFVEPPTQTPLRLHNVLPRLLLEETASADVVWVEAVKTDAADDVHASWREAWDELLLSMNERRDALARHLHGGLLLVGPLWLRQDAQSAAPDLWSFRTLVLEIGEDPIPREPVVEGEKAVVDPAPAAAHDSMSPEHVEETEETDEDDWQDAPDGDEAGPPQVVVCFAPEDTEFVAALDKHLAPLERAERIVVWHRGRARPGDPVSKIAASEIRRADVLILLLGPGLVGSEDLWNSDVAEALSRYRSEGVDLLPVLVRPVDLESTPLQDLVCLPRSGVAVGRPDRDKAWTEVVRALEELLAPRRPQALALQERDDGVYRARRRGELLRRVERVLSLREPESHVERRHAPAPFDGVLLITKPVGRIIDVALVATLDDPVSPAIVDRYIERVHAPHRRESPLLRSTLVHVGDPAPEELLHRAHRAGVVLSTFAEYQGLVDFTAYLRWQTARLDRDESYLPSLYVNQRAEVRVGVDRWTTEDTLETLLEMLRSPHPRFVLVLGDFGTGKTFLLRQLARRMAAEPGALPPVLVEMRELQKSLTLDRLLAQHFVGADGAPIGVPAFRYLLSEGKVALLFDGFDELAFRISYDSVWEHFRTILEAAGGKAKVVVTSRTAHFLNDMEVESALAREAKLVPGYRMFKIAAFDRPRIHEALVKRLGDEEKAAQRERLLSEVQDLMGLSENPRMLAFILESFSPADLEEAKSRGGKLTRAGVYEKLVGKWLGFEVKRASPRGADPPLSEPQLWKVVTDFALLLWPLTEPGLRLRDVPEALWGGLQALSPERQIDTKQVEATAGSRSLLVRDEEGRFSFLHQSILEWLVARDAAAEMASSGRATMLLRKAMSPLMAGFFIDLVGEERAAEWARAVIGQGGSAQKNATLILKQAITRPVEGEGEEIPVDVQLDLSGQDLRGQDFSGMDYLRGADLTRADLSRATLVRADLTGAVLAGAKLVRTNMTGAVLRGADLTGADLAFAVLREADLWGAKLGKAKLTQTDFLGAMLDPEAGEIARGAEKLGRSTAPLIGTTEDLGECRSAAWHPDGTVFATAHEHGIALWDATRARPIRLLRGRSKRYRELTFSPDGQWLAAGTSNGLVDLWSLAGAKDEGLSHEAIGSDNWVKRSMPITALVFSPETRVLAIGDASGMLELRAPGEHRPRFYERIHDSGVVFLGFALDGKLLSVSKRGWIGTWDVEHGRLLSYSQYKSRILCADLSPHRNTIAILDDAHRLVVLKAFEGAWVESFSPVARALSLSYARLTGELCVPEPSGGLAVLQPDGKIARIVLKDLSSFPPHGFSSADRLKCDDLGRHVLIVKRGEAVVVDLAAETFDHAALGGCDRPRAISVSNDDKVLVSAGRTSAHSWFLRRGAMTAASRDYRAESVAATSFQSEAGVREEIAFVDPDGNLRLQGVKGINAVLIAGREYPKLRAGTPTQVVVSPSGRELAVAASNVYVKEGDTRGVPGILVWPVEERTKPKFFPLHAMLGLWGGLWERFSSDKHIGCLAFTPDAGELLVGIQDQIAVVGLSTGQMVTNLRNSTGFVSAISVCPALISRGEEVVFATGSDTGGVTIWSLRRPDGRDSARATAREPFQWDASPVTCLAWSPTGRTLASGSRDCTVALLDLVGGVQTAALRHSSPVVAVAFAGPSVLVSVVKDGAIRLWNVASTSRDRGIGSPLATLLSGENGWVAFTPEGRYKASGEVSDFFWFSVGLTRFEAGELDGDTRAFERPPIRVPLDEPLFEWPPDPVDP